MSSGIPYVLKPDIAPTVEVVPITFDFTAALSPASSGLHITAVDSINVTASPASADPTPSDRIKGGPIIVSSRSTPALPDAAVVIWFGTAVAGCLYKLQCVVSLSDGLSHRTMELELAAKK